MLPPDQVPPVSPNELLSRFVLFSRHIRGNDGTVRPDAFMPHPHVETSVTRHLSATDQELWGEGARVAGLRGTNLHGRADVVAQGFLAQGLTVLAAPILPENPNHANATGWPEEKAEQKMKAIEISRKSRFVSTPT